MNLDASQAQEHLEMVDRILARADAKPLRLVPGMLIAWGIASAAIDAGQQLAVSHVGGRTGIWIADAALLIGFLYTIAVSAALMRNHGYERVFDG